MLSPLILPYPEEKLDALHVKIEVVFEERDANVAEVAAALLVDHVNDVLKNILTKLNQKLLFTDT